jgi:hypothetical protein
MRYLHIKKLEDYQPGYKDRNAIWCKAYFKMINADPEFEMLCEIDKWRFLAFIMMEVQIKNPVILDEEYLTRKGFDFRKRSLQQTIDAIQKSVQIVNDLMQPLESIHVTEESTTVLRNNETCVTTEEKRREEKRREEKIYSAFDFEFVWKKYPKPVGKKKAVVHFNASVKSEADFKDINAALENYLKTKEVKNGYIQNGSTWFNNWRDYINYRDPTDDGIPDDWKTKR